MRLLQPPPEFFWNFEITGVPSDQSTMVVSRPDIHGLFVLNPAARSIWTSLQRGGTRESIIADLTSQFGISPSRAAADVEATLESWSQSLLSPVQETESPAQPTLPPSIKDSFTCDYAIGEKHFRLLVDDPEFVEEIVPRLAHLNADPKPPDVTFRVSRHQNQFQVFSGRSCIGVEPEVGVARTILLQEMARLSRPETDWLAILHAGVCGTSTDCVIMPAATNSGKSTLAAALMHSGLHLYSDDSAALDRRTMHVVSLPFALMLREGSWPTLAPYFPELASAPALERNGDNVRFLAPSLSHSVQTATPKCLLFPEFSPGAPTEIHSLTPFETLLGLQKSGFWVPHNRQSIRTFLSWVQSLPAYQMTYSDLTEAVPAVHGLIQ